MRDILITSSALILALLLLRRLFRKTISRRLQYALWALVLVRLLLPVGALGMPFTPFSVLSVTAPARQAVERQLDAQAHYRDPVRQVTPEELLRRNILVSEVPTALDGSAMILGSQSQGDGAAPPRNEGYLVRDPKTDTVTLYGHMAVGPWELLSAVWKLGMVLMGAFFLLSNLRFWLGLRKNRQEWHAPQEIKRKVYLVPDGIIPSPCLFGQSIYLTPAALGSEESLRHVLCHEEIHARHWDPLWSLLRCVCLTVYWFDPLVWIAALCAGSDCELACDEGALARLGEAERVPYGQTLLSLIPVRRSNPLLAATTMTAGKKQLKDRITRIAQKPRQLLSAVLAVAALTTLAAACTFTGGGSALPDAPVSSPPPLSSPEPTARSVTPVTLMTTIPLTELDPYVPAAVTPRTSPALADVEKLDGTATAGGYVVHLCRTGEDSVCAAYRLEDDHETYYEFFCGLSPEARLDTYHGLLGHDGFYIDHTAGVGGFPQRSYYYFTDDGVLTHLLDAVTFVRGGAFQLDLDGDGYDELVADNSIFFLRDGVLCMAELPALLEKADPTLSVFPMSTQWNVSGKSCSLYGDKENGSTWTRQVFFDGESLHFYRPETLYADHMVDGADKDVPAPVVEQARDFAEACFLSGEEGRTLVDGSFVPVSLSFDDWRIESFEGPYLTVLGEVSVEAWSFNYELHTQTPELVSLAGGRYITEDGWVSPGYPGCDCLFFRLVGSQDHLTRTFLWHDMLNDMSLGGSGIFAQYLEERLRQLGIHTGDVSAAALNIQQDLNYFMDLDEVYLDLRSGPGSESGGARVKTDLKQLPNAGNRQYYFTDPSTFRWSLVTSLPDYQAGDYGKTPSFTIIDGADWDRYLRFWPGSEYVLSAKPGEGGTWYRAENMTDPEDVFYDESDIYSYMRLLFDEAEFDALQAAALAAEPRLTRDFTDDFRLYDWSMAWATQYELASAQVSPGSRFAFSWQKVLEVEVTDQTEDHMSIWYTLAFTPENDLSRRWCWPGNTDEFKNFPYPDQSWGVPDGALYYGRVLRLAKADGVWYIEGAGTG